MNARGWPGRAVIRGLAEEGESLWPTPSAGSFAARVFEGLLAAAKADVSRWERPYAGHVPPAGVTP
jgi:hypothetical protein